jgi:hypothetical protein
MPNDADTDSTRPPRTILPPRPTLFLPAEPLVDVVAAWATLLDAERELTRILGSYRARGGR